MSVQFLYIVIRLLAFFFWFSITALYILDDSPLCNKHSINTFAQSLLPYYSLNVIF